jgi:hypothetical protein
MLAVTVAGFAVFLSADAAAQTCRGTAPLKQNRSYQASGGFWAAEGISAAAVTFVSGDSIAFVAGHYAHARYPDIDRSSNFVGISGGLELPGRAADRFVVCPMLTVLQEWGPNNLPDENLTFNRSNTRVTGGASVGVIAARSKSLIVIPTLSLGLTGVRYDFNFSDNQTESGSDHFGQARVGVGLVLGRSLTITPSVDIPFGAKIEERIVRVDVTWSFGGR